MRSLYSIPMHWLLAWFECSERELRESRQGKQYGAGLIDSPLLCRQPRDRHRSLLTGRSQTLYIRDCCWQVRFVQPDLDGHTPCRRDISSLLLCPAASPLTGSLWTDHRVSVHNRGQPSANQDPLRSRSQSYCSGFIHRIISSYWEHIVLYMYNW